MSRADRINAVCKHHGITRKAYTVLSKNEKCKLVSSYCLDVGINRGRPKGSKNFVIPIGDKK